MNKISRKETKDLAALVLKYIKTTRPDLDDRQIRSVCSTLYAQLKENKAS